MSETTAALAPGDPSGDEVARYLTFTLRGEIYALDILEITEIIEYRSLTVVPMMPSFIRGVINLRGRVLPVVDLAVRFGQDTTTVARRTSIIVVHSAARLEDAGSSESSSGIGIMVDGVNEVIHIDATDIEPPPAFGVGIRSDFISGMAKHNGGFVIVLAIAKVLSMDETALLNEVSAAEYDPSENGQQITTEEEPATRERETATAGASV